MADEVGLGKTIEGRAAVHVGHDADIKHLRDILDTVTA
jgi:hypothetical protein